MSWFADQRQAWIMETLRIFGAINRRHLQLKFGISSAQAALDFKAFRTSYPQALEYDPEGRQYVTTADYTPASKLHNREGQG